MTANHLPKLLHDPDLWTRTSALIELVLPTLTPATLEEIHAEALKREYTDLVALKSFVRRFDVDKVIRKKYIHDGRVQVNPLGQYVWLASHEGKKDAKSAKKLEIVKEGEAKVEGEPKPANPVPPAPEVPAKSETPASDKRDLESLNKGELVEMAKTLKIETKGLNKEQIIDAINAASANAGVSA